MPVMPETDSQSIDGGEELSIKHRKSYKASEDNFAPCFKVTLKGSKSVLVPIDKTSSDNQRSILIALARDLVRDQLEKIAVVTLTPAELKDLVKAVAEMDALQREQYVTSLNNPTTAMGKGLGNLVQSATAGAVAGAAGFVEQMRKMDAAAAKAAAVKSVQSIDV